MIQWRDPLLAIAEIAIAITGFSGLIGILARRERLDRSSIEFFRLRWMLEYSLITLGLSLLPFLIFAAGLSEESSWRLSSALAFGGFIFYLPANRAFLSDFLKRATPFERAMAWVDLALMLVLAENAVGLPFDPSALPYLGAVYWNLFGAALGFVRLIALTWSRRDDPDSSD
jgi:hypothetical protein